MRILMVSSYLPYPLYSGGHIRLYNLLKNLSKKHEITLVCEKREYQTKKDIGEIEKICKKVIAVDKKKQWSFKTILSTGFSNSPFLITGHTNLKMQNEIRAFLKNEKFDLIHVETFYVMQNLPKVSIPIVLVEHNIEYLVYKRYADKAPVWIRPLLAIDIAKLKSQEEAFWQKANYLVAVSQDDERILRTKNKNIEIVPNGVDIKKFKVKSSKLKVQKKEKLVLFIGDFRWVQNRDTAKWILKEVWPNLKLKLKNQKSEFNFKLWMVGKNIPGYIKKLGDKNVVFDENAPSRTSEIFQRADLLLSPIRVGGGTSYKIIEAMSCGVPVITTKMGASPIGAINNKDVIVSEDKNKITEEIIRLFRDKEFYKIISENARKLVEKRYDWKIISEKLDSVYRLAVK